MTDHPLPWRVGSKVGRNLYDAQGTPIGQLDTSALARLAVDAVNDRHRFEAIEQELRETAGELEKATALLDLFVDGARNALQFMRDDLPSAAEEMLKAILSHAPAQPAAPTTRPRCAEHEVPLANEAFFKCGCRYLGQPAAPEPSGELDWSAMYTRREAELSATQESSFAHAAARESAEAQLAAVGAIATDMIAQLENAGYRPAKTRATRDGWFIEALMRGFVDIADLLTAPSPGAGEETL